MVTGIVSQINLERLDKTQGYQVVVNVGAGATRVIDFRQEFQAIAKNVLLDNQDLVNPATYRVNSRGDPTRTLRADSTRNVGVAIELMEINAGAAGGVEVSAEVVPIELIEKIL